MISDICYIDIPDFRTTYEVNTEYGYTGNAKKNLDKLLREKSKNHCMYCYALLRSDRVNTGNIEHAIEKDLSDFLEDCVPNMGLACTHCNTSLKRVGEKRRKKYTKSAIQEFEENLECKGKKCKGECVKYKDLKGKYCEIGKIILQPGGVKGRISQCDYRIQYDILRAEFVPSSQYEYDAYDKEYIEHHINQFRLNDPEYKTTALAEFIEETIERDGKYSKRCRQSNYIVDLFIKKLEPLSQDEVLKICEKIYTTYKVLYEY